MENNKKLKMVQNRAWETEKSIGDIIHKLNFIKNHGLSEEEITSLEKAKDVLDKLYNNLEFEIE